MQVSPIDDNKDLFRVGNILSQELLLKLSQEVIEAIPYTTQEGQEEKPRRKLQKFPGSTLSQIHNHINTHKDVIGKEIEQDIDHIDTAFWYDREGFDFPTHIDNPQVKIVMQIYLSDCEGAGTVFYNVADSDIGIKDGKSLNWHYIGPIPPTNVRREFEFKTNTGYLMFNHMKQVHGVPKKLGNDDMRLSVYCWIY